jgi:hypothetical protein
VWGFNGYGRLGLGTSQDVLSPKLHPHVRRTLWSDSPTLRVLTRPPVRGTERGDHGRPRRSGPRLLGRR